MISTVARSLLTRSVLKSGRQYAFSSSAVTSRYLSNILLGAQGESRLFSVSTRLASPVAAKKTPVKKSATKAPAKKKTKTTTKKKATATATKRKTTVAKQKKKVVPKKRKVVAAKKSRVSVRRPKVKKVVPKKVTPRTDASLRPPPRSISAYSLYVKRMWPTISPRPTDVVKGMAHIQTMWKALNAAEKQPFVDEASVLTRQRGEIYDKWRAGLSRSQVVAINASRKGSKHGKLGRVTTPGAPKKPIKGYVKFFSESFKNGTIDLKKAPEGTRPVIYASKEASKMWKAMTPEQKKSYT